MAEQDVNNMAGRGEGRKPVATASKTDAFLKGISVTTTFTIVGGLIGIVHFSVMSRMLTKADFGYFAALTGIMSIVSAIADADK